MANVTETIEGVINDRWWFHYDVASDVLYLRLNDERSTQTVAEETEEGLLQLRSDRDDRIVGATIVNWWNRFGEGALPDSLRELHSHVVPWTERIAA